MLPGLRFGGLAGVAGAEGHGVVKLDGVVNVVFAGLGGQGVLKASDILAAVAFEAGLDVKKSELHGMSQRGGSVTSDVRFGSEVLSPMVPVGEADYLIVLAAESLARDRRYLRETGVLITPEVVPAGQLPNPKCLNVALLGVLSRHLPFDESLWQAAIEAHLPQRVHAANVQAFRIGRTCGARMADGPCNAC